jgi:hypothetical protein
VSAPEHIEEAVCINIGGQVQRIRACDADHRHGRRKKYHFLRMLVFSYTSVFAAMRIANGRTILLMERKECSNRANQLERET